MNLNGCRFCGTKLEVTLVDLGMSPLCESYITQEQLHQMEPFYPLHVYVCHECFLVQLDEFVNPENIFSEYAYFSSYSVSWLNHAELYTDEITERLGLDESSFVIELASNDGYLLQYFVEKGIPVLGVEPAANIAIVAEEKGVPTLVDFFGINLAEQIHENGQVADLIVGNNVLAQVPDVNDFISGMKIILKPAGVVTMEFPHLLKLLQENQFDTIYHEHFSYFSLLTVEKIFSHHEFTVFDVDELPTHGGSLRIYVRHAEDDSKPISDNIYSLREKEEEAGIGSTATYSHFEENVKRTKRKLLDFLITAKTAGYSVAGYGAPGKGNTLLNYCGIRTDFLEFTVDRNPYKQGKFLPGTHIPIYHPDRIKEAKPDYVLILPWNFKDEIMDQLSFIREWGGKFIIPIPEATVI